jgi:protein-S-isoprenylcysteine O-methyltransferase Ste14
MLERLELRVPPPLLSLLTALMMWLGARNSLPYFQPSWIRPAAIALGVLGIAIDLWAIRTMRRARTTVNPMHPAKASALVTTGIFAVSRNPIYLGSLLVLTAFALHLWQPQAFVAVPVWAAWIQRFQIVPEERALRAAFGESFSAYCTATRRWI